jgi:hypothetical protein
MEQHEPERPSSPPPGTADEALRRLEQRLSRASEAAERLIAQAADSAAAAAAGSGSGSEAPQGEPPRRAPTEPPPSGWQVPRDEEEQRGDLELLMQVIRSLRDLIPPDLQRRLAEALRELLLALRALIDWYLERSEQRRSARAEMQDIPIL